MSIILDTYAQLCLDVPHGENDDEEAMELDLQNMYSPTRIAIPRLHGAIVIERSAVKYVWRPWRIVLKRRTNGAYAPVTYSAYLYRKDQCVGVGCSASVTRAISAAISETRFRRRCAAEMRQRKLNEIAGTVGMVGA